MVKVNGEFIETNGKSVSELLSELGYNTARVAVELNEEILPKSKYDTVPKEGDNLEIVGFVGGG